MGNVTPTFSNVEAGTGISRMSPSDFTTWFSAMIRSGQKLPTALPLTADQKALVDKWQAVLDKDPVYQAEIARSTKEMADLARANAEHDAQDQNPLASAIDAAYAAQSAARANDQSAAITARMEQEMRAFLMGGPQVDFTKPEYSGGSNSPYLGTGQIPIVNQSAAISAAAAQFQQMAAVRAAQDQSASLAGMNLQQQGVVYQQYQKVLQTGSNDPKNLRDWQTWAAQIPKSLSELTRMQEEINGALSRGEISGYEADVAFKQLRSQYDAYQTAQMVARYGVRSYSAAPTNYATALSNYTSQLTTPYTSIPTSPYGSGFTQAMGGTTVSMPVYVYTNDPQVTANTLTTNLWQNGVKTR